MLSATSNNHPPPSQETHPMQLNPQRLQVEASIEPDVKGPQCKPLQSMEELLNWHPGHDDFNVSNTPLHPRSYVQSSAPELKVIVCHDMAGGYVEDAATQGNDYETIYNLQSWRYIDTFIYFSHARVTIPPPCWTNAAHRNGVKSLGTFITEWKPGVLETDLLVSGPGAVFETDPPPKDPKGSEKGQNVGDGTGGGEGGGGGGGAGEGNTEKVDRRWFSKVFADKLVDVAVYYKFDGWLINIESPLRGGNAQAKQMVAFLSYLRQQLHARIPGGELIWYDSVIYSNGSLAWQDGLTKENMHFFEQSDGIFTNYTWEIPQLEKSVKLAETRARDVYTGIDVWGRGTFGGGGFNSYKALEAIKSEGSSLALFAPGYIYQNLGKEDFLVNDRLFWTGFSGAGIHAEGVNKVPKLPPPPPPPRPPPPPVTPLPPAVPPPADPGNVNSSEPSGGTDEENFLPVAALVEGRPSGCKTWFYTDFDRGFGKKIFINGKAVREEPWSNLSRQSLPPNMANDVHVLQQALRSDGSGVDLNLKKTSQVRWILSPNDAFYGGTSVLIEQVVEDPEPISVNEQTTVAIPLYDTQISLADSAAWSVELVFKRLEPGVELILYMGVNHPFVENVVPVKAQEKARWNPKSGTAPILIAQGVPSASACPSNAASLMALDAGRVEGGVQTTQNLGNGWHRVVVSLTGMLQPANFAARGAPQNGSVLAQLGVTLSFPTATTAPADGKARPLALLGSLSVLPLKTSLTTSLFAVRASETSMKVVRRPLTPGAPDGQTCLQVWSTLDWDIGYSAVPQSGDSPKEENILEAVSPTDYSHYNIYLTYEPRTNDSLAPPVNPVYVGTAFNTKYRITGVHIPLTPSSVPTVLTAFRVGGSRLTGSPFRLTAWVQGVRRHGRLDPQEEWISRELS